jgi:hypothetical protein
MISLALQIPIAGSGIYPAYIQNYWILGLCPSLGILKTRENEVLETGFTSIFR